MTPDERRAYLMAPIIIRVVGSNSTWSGFGTKGAGTDTDAVRISGFRQPLDGARPERGYRIWRFRGHE